MTKKEPTPVTSVEGEWRQVSLALISEFGDAAYKSWLQPLGVRSSHEQDAVTMLAPTRFMRDWVQANYAERICNLWQRLNPEIKHVEVSVDSLLAPRAPSAPEASSFEASKTSTKESTYDFTSNLSKRGRASDEALIREEMGASLDSRFTFENFVVGKPNELAYAAALRVAESETVHYNPLFLYGGVGLGKTHLMHAIAWRLKQSHPGRRVIYLSAEKFMYQFIRALRFKDTVAFKEQFRSVDVLMIDDVQFIGGKESTQEEFFHTFNALVDQNRQVIISADKSPSDLEGMEERLKSRLGWGLVADIHPTTYELRLGILQLKAESLQADVPKEVLEFLAVKISSNIRELEGALNRLIAHSTLVGREITLETAHEVLRDVLKSNDRRITIEDIQRRVAEFYHVKISDMQSPRRAQNIARPRQVAMYLVKALTSRSLPDIGRKFGGRDHTTVLHAVRKIEELMGLNPEFAQDVSVLKCSLQG